MKSGMRSENQGNNVVFKYVTMVGIVLWLAFVYFLAAGQSTLFSSGEELRLLFHSSTFLFLFLPLILLSYCLLPGRFQKGILLVGSLLLYAWAEPVYLPLLLLLITFNYFCGLEMKDREDQPWKRDNSVLIAVAFDLLVLLFCRCGGMLADSLNKLPVLQISFAIRQAPPGIVVFILLAISYQMDVYRGKIVAENGWLDLALYLSMFPQLASGLLVKYQDLKEQLRTRQVTSSRFGEGAMLFIRGMGKAMVMVAVLGRGTQELLQLKPGSFSVLSAWLGCILYALKLYYLISGYSDMAGGLALFFGMTFKKNFEYPYTAESLGEFSEKWYLSLGSWFRENVFQPLGGEEKGKGRTALNLLLVWALTGLCYGASWKFLLWGLYFGLFLVLERFFLSRVLIRLPSFVRHLYVLLLVFIGWVFFLSPDLGYAFRYLGIMFGIGASGFADSEALYLVLNNWLFILLGVAGCTTLGYRILQRTMYDMRTQRVRTVVACVVYGAIFLLSVAYMIM